MGSRSVRALFLGAAVSLAASLAASTVQAQIYSASQYYAGPGAVESAAGDLNGDGRLDVAAINYDATVGILLGNANQGFGPASFYYFGGTGSNPSNIELGDYNQDGSLDVVIALAGVGTLKFIPGNGAGQLGAETTLFPGQGGSTVQLVDVDSDGNVDAVYARNNYGLVGVYMGNGSGPFGAHHTIPVTGGSRAVVVGDLNLDGRKDLVVASDFLVVGVSVLLGTISVPGTLLFSPQADFPVPGGPQDLRLADFDNDGIPDVTTANYNGKSVSFLMGNGAGGFGAPSSATIPSFSQEVRVGDVTGDGNADAVVTSGGRVSILLGTGTGAMAPPVNYDVPGSQSTRLADLDGNGRDEILASFYGAGALGIGIYRPDAAGAILTPEIYGFGQTVQGFNDLSVGDVDGDGRVDMVTAHASGILPPFLSGHLLFAKGSPTGTFPTQTIVDVNPYFRVTLADLTLDGKLDAVTVLLSLSTLRVLAGNGSGGFTHISTTPTVTNPFAIAVADVDGDGLPDAIASGGGSDTVHIYIGNGGGAFAAEIVLPSPGFPLETQAADLNNDGVLDLVTANNVQGIRVYLGTGGASFAPAVQYIPTFYTNGVRVDDFDTDGDFDVAVASTSSQIYVFQGDGTGALSGPTFYFTTFPSSVEEVAVSDVDADGKRDLVAPCLGSGTIAVLRGTGGGAFATPEFFLAGGSPASVDLVDVDVDGRPDVVVNILSKVSVLRNQLSDPLGASSYGTGTPGCSGILGITANSPPQVGSSSFGVAVTHAPRRSLGLGIITDVQDVAGSDPFFLGTTLHVGIVGASQLIPFDVRSDDGGTAFASTPIPNSPFLVGSNFYFQTLWLESTSWGWACSPSIFHLATSAALQVTVLP